MSNDASAARAEHTLKLGLRVIATVSLLALIFVAAPYSWMNAIHAWLGMGELPQQPIVGYLARSCSALYALIAGLAWVISFDLRRHYHVLRYLALAFILFGIALLAIDWFEQLPPSWTFTEGPMLILFGILMFYLMRKARLSRP